MKQSTLYLSRYVTDYVTVALYVFLLQCMHMAFKLEIHFVHATPLLSFTKHLVIFGPVQGTGSPTEQDEEIW